MKYGLLDFVGNIGVAMMMIAYLLLLGGAMFLLRRFGIEESAGFWVWLFLAGLVGMEASSLLRWKLARRRFEQVGIVVGDDREEAERRFFDRWDEDEARPAAAAPAPPSPFGPPPATSAPARDVIGLFPQPQARP